MRRAGRTALTALVLSTGIAAYSEPQEIVLGGNALDSEPRTSWKLGERIPVECLNRTTDTGEHITDARGELQYIPFPICNETGRPLELIFGSEADINCTIDSMYDSLFHLFEFYIHNDAPLSCRLPSLPPAPAASTESSPSYTHLQIALSGTLQLSHLHINPQLNVIVHTTASAPANDAAALLTSNSRSKNRKKKKQRKPEPAPPPNGLVSEGALLAAAAYSLPPSTQSSPRIVIGDPLPLVLTVRWFSERTLPPSTARLPGKQPGLGGHVHVSTVLYCLLSFGGGVALSLAYWRGIELPRRLRYYGADRLGMGFEGGRGGYAFPGKRD